MAGDLPPGGVVDASVLIAHLNREPGRYQDSLDLLMDAEEGTVDLWAPMLIQVEVSHWAREVEVDDPDLHGRLAAYLESGWLRLVEVDRRMSETARDVIATTGVGTAVEACYVATAALVGAPVVFTWDADLGAVRYRDVTGMQPPGSLTPRLDLALA